MRKQEKTPACNPTHFFFACLGNSPGRRQSGEGIWDGPGPWAVSINTSKQRWELRPLEKAARQIAGSRAIEEITQSTADSEFKPGFYRQAQELISAFKKLPTESVTLNQSLQSMRLIKQIFLRS